MPTTRCCVPGCNETQTSNCCTKLHRFPKPDKQPERFLIWMHSIHGNILSLDNKFIYNNHRVCRCHFEDKFHFGKKLTANAVPTLKLQGLKHYSPLRDRTNHHSPAIINYQPVHPTTSQQAVASYSESTLASSFLEVHPSTSQQAVASYNDSTLASSSFLEVHPTTSQQAVASYNDSTLASSSFLEVHPTTSQQAVASYNDSTLASSSFLEVHPTTSQQAVASYNDSTLASSSFLEVHPTTSQQAVASYNDSTLASSSFSGVKQERRQLSRIFCRETIALKKQLHNAQMRKHHYAARLKNAIKLSHNQLFQKLSNRFDKSALMFLNMQFREIKKRDRGRRFSQEEKVMALTLYKQGPKAYRWLRKIFVLPSSKTLRAMISSARLEPGLNENLFIQLEERVRKMKSHEKLCALLFDEMAITPHLSYNTKNDRITGFINDGKNVFDKFANHVLVFMIRGITFNYKQPVSYTFCGGSTNKHTLGILITEIIKKLHSIGLIVTCTICDQGSSNVSALNYLVEKTKIEYLKNGSELRQHIFEVDGKKVAPLFDPPHLIKCIRNNLLFKNLKCVINGQEKTASWEHILHLHKENPGYKGIRLLPKLTENHVMVQKISKMKVKLATQVFSSSVASSMGYLADKGILPKESKDTADVLLFFDELFDSLNGSYNNFKKRGKKKLLGPVKLKSKHHEVWVRAKMVLHSMRFVTKAGKTVTAPSIKNWLLTIENIEYLIKLFSQEYNLNSIWLRHFNQDPLENFFGCIRSHGCRNNSPTCSAFEAAFASLLINNVSSFHSSGSNCEDDSCFIFKSLNRIFFNNTKLSSTPVNIDYEDIIANYCIDFHSKMNSPRIWAALEYVTGYVLRQLKIKVFRNCDICKQFLYDHDQSCTYIKIREYISNKSSLAYPALSLIKCFSDIQDIVTQIIKFKCSIKDISNYIKTVLSIHINYDFLKCEVHKSDIIKVLQDLSCNFFLYNRCKDINKILCGKHSDIDDTDRIQSAAKAYFISRRKHH